MSYFMGKISVVLSRSGTALSTPHISDMSAYLPGLPPTVAGRSFFESCSDEDRAVGREPDHAVRAVDAERPERFLEQPERARVGALRDLGVLHRRDHVLVIRKRIPEGPVGVVHDVGEDLGVGIVAHVPRVAAAREELADRHEGRVLAVRHRGVALDEEGMAGIEVDGVVRVLPALGQDDLRLDARLLDAEELAHFERVPHFLQGQHIGVEGEDEERPVGLAHDAERKPRLHQQVFLLLLRLVLVGRGIIVDLGDIVLAALDAGHVLDRRLPGELLGEALGLHVLLEHGQALARADGGQGRVLLVVDSNGPPMSLSIRPRPDPSWPSFMVSSAWMFSMGEK